MSHPATHPTINRAYWNQQSGDWVAAGERLWASAPNWGIWGLPEQALNLLPADMTGWDAIELGCGTGYVGGWMARRGARVVGVDLAEGQLGTARRLADQHRVELALIQANAERVPCADASFDFAISEYGAAIWCDPLVWIPEAHRLLRPGGELVFLGTSTLACLCLPGDGALPCTGQLQRDGFDLHRLDWTEAADEPGGVEFNLPLSGWLRLFRETGFTVLDFQEPRAPAPGPETRFFVTADWAWRWPAEQVWRLRKEATDGRAGAAARSVRRSQAGPE